MLIGLVARRVEERLHLSHHAIEEIFLCAPRRGGIHAERRAAYASAHARALASEMRANGAACAGAWCRVAAGTGRVPHGRGLLLNSS